MEFEIKNIVSFALRSKKLNVGLLESSFGFSHVDLTEKPEGTFGPIPKNRYKSNKSAQDWLWRKLQYSG